MPLIVVSASGGARMQEGTLALMQLAKTVAAIERLRAAGVPFISVLSDPTTGGVFASFAALGDVNVAEPNALIGFAGARVTSGTIAQELPPGFQRSEFLFSHGFLDRVVHRSELQAELAGLLGYLVPAQVEPEASGMERDRACRRSGRSRSCRTSPSGSCRASRGRRRRRTAPATNATAPRSRPSPTRHRQPASPPVEPAVVRDEPEPEPVEEPVTEARRG